jgi:hypothetical protein
MTHEVLSGLGPHTGGANSPICELVFAFLPSANRWNLLERKVIKTDNHVI